VNPELYEQEWVLVVTSLGDVLLGQGADIGIPVDVGTVLQWEANRWGLYSVV
jgi:hypothetical protein